MLEICLMIRLEYKVRTRTKKTIKDKIKITKS